MTLKGKEGWVMFPPPKDVPVLILRTCYYVDFDSKKGVAEVMKHLVMGRLSCVPPADPMQSPGPYMKAPRRTRAGNRCDLGSKRLESFKEGPPVKKCGCL